MFRRVACWTDILRHGGLQPGNSSFVERKSKRKNANAYVTMAINESTHYDVRIKSSKGS